MEWVAISLSPSKSAARHIKLKNEFREVSFKYQTLTFITNIGLLPSIRLPLVDNLTQANFSLLSEKLA